MTNNKIHKILLVFLFCYGTIVGQQKLFVVTKSGGSLNGGTVLAFDPDAGQQKTKVNFGKHGLNRWGSVVQDGNGFLYGLMSLGGHWGSGCIFKIKNDGTGYSQLYDFAGANSGGDGNSDGSLALLGNTL